MPVHFLTDNISDDAGNVSSVQNSSRCSPPANCTSPVVSDLTNSAIDTGVGSTSPAPSVTAEESSSGGGLVALGICVALVLVIAALAAVWQVRRRRSARRVMDQLKNGSFFQVNTHATP